MADPGPMRGSSSLWLAFSGDPSDPRRHVLEAIALDRESMNYNFYRFQFSEDGSSAPAVLVNPTGEHSCVRCHRGRPLWDGISVRPFWPGVYGGAHDAAIPLLDRESRFFVDEFVPVSRSGRYALLEEFAGINLYPMQTLPGFQPGQESLHRRLFFLESGIAASLAEVAFARMREAPNYLIARAAILAATIGTRQGGHGLLPAEQFLPADFSSGVDRTVVLNQLLQFEQRKSQRHVEALGLRAQDLGFPIWGSRSELSRNLAITWSEIFAFLEIRNGSDLLSSSFRDNSFDLPTGLNEALAKLVVDDAFLDHFELLENVLDFYPSGPELKSGVETKLLNVIREIARLDHEAACERKVL